MPYETEAWLRTMLSAARRATKPGEVNAEYVHGQVSLIYDVLPLPGPGDLYYGLMTRAITGQVPVGETVRQILEIADDTT